MYVPASILENARRSQGDDLATYRSAIEFVFEFAPLFIAILIAIFGGLWVRRASHNYHASIGPFAEIVFTFVRMRFAGLMSLLCLFLSPDLFLILMVIRYVVIERFRRQPILYLRSFHHDRAVEIFGSAVSPALAPFGIIKGLVHQKQRASVLLSRTSIWQFGTMLTVSDDHWQEWVLRSLKNVRLVVVDISILTESILWEIDRVLENVDRRKILIITDDESRIFSTTDIAIAHYGADLKSGACRLRQYISTWATVVLSSSRSRSRWAVVAWVLVASLAVLSKAGNLLVLMDK